MYILTCLKIIKQKNYNKNLVSDAWQHADELVLVNEHLKQGFEEISLMN